MSLISGRAGSQRDKKICYDRRGCPQRLKPPIIFAASTARLEAAPFQNKIQNQTKSRAKQNPGPNKIQSQTKSRTKQNREPNKIENQTKSRTKQNLHVTAGIGAYPFKTKSKAADKSVRPTRAISFIRR
jgi:hypothetical protein